MPLVTYTLHICNSGLRPLTELGKQCASKIRIPRDYALDIPSSMSNEPDVRSGSAGIENEILQDLSLSETQYSHIGFRGNERGKVLEEKMFPSDTLVTGIPSLMSLHGLVGLGGHTQEQGCEPLMPPLSP